jgi:SAM-dependent methyltransferase
MKNNWQNVWDKRQLLQQPGESLLESLIKMDGFDSPLGSISEADWRAYVDSVIKLMELRSHETVFEIGCGSGAFLYVLYERGIQVSGVDYSSAMIEIAKKIMPKNASNFEVLDALAIDVIQADAIIANHVFHYFPSYEYVRMVLEKVLKTESKVLLTALPDIRFKEASEMFRKDKLTDQEYKIKYDGLDILYFSKSWILDEINRLSPKRKVFFLPYTVETFPQNEFRFDCLIL